MQLFYGENVVSMSVIGPQKTRTNNYEQEIATKIRQNTKKNLLQLLHFFHILNWRSLLFLCSIVVGIAWHRFKVHNSMHFTLFKFIVYVARPIFAQ